MGGRATLSVTVTQADVVLKPRIRLVPVGGTGGTVTG